MNETELSNVIKIERLGYDFLDKPVLVGGLAMEYYGLRKHGDDIDFIVSERDYQNLKRRFPKNRKDVWGDFGILVDGFELFRSIYRFDRSYYAAGAIEHGQCLVVSIERLFRMKVYAMDAGEKHQNDVKIIKKHFDEQQNEQYRAYLDRHIARYTGSETGIFLGVEYSDDD
jgi:hypothetical protein